MTIDLWSRIGEDERAIVARFTSEVPVKVGELAAALGVDVLRSPLEPNISGLIQPSGRARSGFEIKVNKFESKERQRFTVAHEIAHYLLHRSEIGQGVYDTALYRSNLTSRKEVEANKLAADIVMPHAAIRSKLVGRPLPTGEVEVAGLASEFGVSPPAMKIRLGLA